jgi:hypothetical protein
VSDSPQPPRLPLAGLGPLRALIPKLTPTAPDLSELPDQRAVALLLLLACASGEHVSCREIHGSLWSSQDERNRFDYDEDGAMVQIRRLVSNAKSILGPFRDHLNTDAPRVRLRRELWENGVVVSSIVCDGRQFFGAGPADPQRIRKALSLVTGRVGEGLVIRGNAGDWLDDLRVRVDSRIKQLLDDLGTSLRVRLPAEDIDRLVRMTQSEGGAAMLAEFDRLTSPAATQRTPAPRNRDGAESEADTEHPASLGSVKAIGRKGRLLIAAAASAIMATILVHAVTGSGSRPNVAAFTVVVQGRRISLSQGGWPPRRLHRVAGFASLPQSGPPALNSYDGLNRGPSSDFTFLGAGVVTDPGGAPLPDRTRLEVDPGDIVSLVTYYDSDSSTPALATRGRLFIPTGFARQVRPLALLGASNTVQRVVAAQATITSPTPIRLVPIPGGATLLTDPKSVVNFGVGEFVTLRPSGSTINVAEVRSGPLLGADGTVTASPADAARVESAFLAVPQVASPWPAGPLGPAPARSGFPCYLVPHQPLEQCWLSHASPPILNGIYNGGVGGFLGPLPIFSLIRFASGVIISGMGSQTPRNPQPGEAIGVRPGDRIDVSAALGVSGGYTVSQVAAAIRILQPPTAQRIVDVDTVFASQFTNPTAVVDDVAVMSATPIRLRLVKHSVVLILIYQRGRSEATALVNLPDSLVSVVDLQPDWRTQLDRLDTRGVVDILRGRPLLNNDHLAGMSYLTAEFTVVGSR